jgi:hypothetical protein
MGADEVTICRADIGHAYDLAEALREADRLEVEAATGRDVLPVLIESIETSSEAWAVHVDGRLLCVWGVVPLEESLLGRVGAGWLLTTDLVERYAKAFWRLCLRLLPGLLERWDLLVNAIDVRHEKAIRWARRLGFNLQAPAPFGAAGLPFCAFTVHRGDLRV